MFKKKLEFGSHIETHSFLYCQYDRTTGSTSFYQVADNNARAILNILHATTIPLTQSDLLCLAEVHSKLPRHEQNKVPNLDFKDTLEYTFYDKPRLVEWSEARFPETEAEALAPLGLSDDDTKSIIDDYHSRFNITKEVK